MAKPWRRSRTLALAAIVLLGCGFVVWRWNQRAGHVEGQSQPAATAPQAQEAAVSGPGLTKSATPPLVSTGVAPVAVPDRWVGCPELARREEPPANRARQRWTVTRLVKDQNFKRPLLRVTESWQVGAAGPVLTRQSAMVADHVLLRLHPKASIESVLQRFRHLSPSVRQHLPASRLWLISFEAAELDTVPKAVEQMRRARDLVERVGPDYVVHATLQPNDPSFSQLWGLHNTGQSGGTADADIDAPEAWDLSTGSRSVVVAVIDTGISQTHQDLAANLWTNTREIPGNGQDDDHNGYVDDVHGWDFYNNDSNPEADHMHGTHVSGTIGAAGNNNTGITGVCWKVSLMGLKFLGASGSGTTADAIEALYYATGEGASITSNSYGGGEYEQIFKDAIEDADAAGCLFVAAAGNSAGNNDVNPFYPASYNNANVISVAALNRRNGLASFSCYGATTVDLAAPGEEIYSTLGSNTYGMLSGTSMATPHVSGVCALVKAFKPSLSHHDIKALVLGSAQPVTALAGKCTTSGLLNARAALDAANNLLISPADGFAATAEMGGEVTPVSRSYTIKNNGSTTATWTSTVTPAWLSLSPTSGSLAPGRSISITAQIAPSVNTFAIGTYSGSMVITSSIASRTYTLPVTLEVTQQRIVRYDFESPASFVLQGQWQEGAPLGHGGLFGGGPDPTSGATGPKVIGINLAGDYAPEAAGPFYATSPVIDCRNFTATKLRFYGWMNMDAQPWTTTWVQASADGVNWTTLLTNSTGATTQDTWTRYEVDLARVADLHPEVRVRFGYQTIGGVIAYSGWNLDDVQVLGTPVKRLQLALPVNEVTEGSAALTATVTISPAPVVPIMLSLASSDVSQATVTPSSLVISPGQTVATVQVQPVNDTAYDGSQSVLLKVTSPEWETGYASLTIHDNESQPLTLTLPLEASEGDELITGTVSVPFAVGSDVQVQLSSSDLTELEPPASITILAGETSRNFNLAVADDHELDGDQTVVVTASVQGWSSGTSSVIVHDNDPRSLAVSLRDTYAENEGVVTESGLVSLAGTLATDLVVTLASSDSAHLSVPATVTIPAGAMSAAFDVTLTADPAVTGELLINITAQATTFSSGLAVVHVHDLQSVAAAALPSPAHLSPAVSPDSDLSWSIVPGTGVTPTSYEVYFGTTASLTAANLLGTVSSTSYVLPHLSRATTYFWRVDARVGTAVTTGTLWSFTVPPVGQVTQLTWGGVPSSIAVETAFSPTLTAQDEFGDAVTSFNGTAVLTTPSGASKMLITEIDYDPTARIEFTNVSNAAVDISGWQVVSYDEFSWPAPSITLTIPNGTVVQAGAVFMVTESGVMPGSYPSFQLGVYQYWTKGGRLAVMLRNAGGSMVDFVAVGASAAEISSPMPVPQGQWSGDTLASFSTNAVAWLRRGDADGGSAADWLLGTPSIATLNSGLLLPFPAACPALEVSPSMVTFSNGVWSGPLRIRQPSARTRLLATQGLAQGLSSALAVIAQGALTITQTKTSALETAGTVTNVATVSLPAPAVSDVTIQLVSSDVSEVASGTLLIPAGQQSGSASLVVLDDALLDGSQQVAIEVYAPGYAGGTLSFIVHDDEAATLSLALPASASEADGSVQGTVTLSAPADSAVTVALSSSNAAACTVPSSVVVPAGGTSASFTVVITNDAWLDGTQSAVVTASVTGWTAGSAGIDVLDDEQSSILLSAPFSMTEGQTGVTGTLRIGGLAVTALSFSLSSDNATQLTVPASVTVPAGSDQVSFAITPVDDALRDGASYVSITATRAGFTPDTTLVNVLDNDVHHFTQAVIPTNQVAGVPFTWTVQAWDVNGVPIISPAGPVTMTLNQALAYAPSSATGFVDSFWRGPVRVLAAGSNVRLTLTAPGGVSIQSNAFTVSAGPLLSVTPASLSATVLQGDSVTTSLLLGNIGPVPLDWALAHASSSVLATSPVFTAVPPVDMSTWTSPASNALETTDLPAAHPTLESVLAALNAGSSRVTSLIALRNDFTGGTTGSSIFNGGNDMYVEGNSLSTSLSPDDVPLMYSDGVILNEASFGFGGRCFTRKVPGLFVLAADTRLVQRFEIAGYLGAQSAGQVDGAVLRLSRNGKAWNVLLKRVCTAFTPSVVHMVLVPDLPGITHQFSQASDYDTHVVDGLGSVSRFYYLLLSQQPGVSLSNDEAGAIAGTFLDVVNGTSSWVTASPDSGTLAPAGSSSINVSLSAAGLPLGTTVTGLTVVSNDALSNPVHVSVTLTVLNSTPALASEPAYTGGTSNSLSWGAISGGSVLYEVQRDTAVDFSTTQSSGWIASVGYTFSNLVHGTNYLYRVRARNTATGNTFGWSPVVSSIQDALPPDVVFGFASGGFTALSSYNTTGTASDLSGVASLSFTPPASTSVQATTSDQFAHWSVTLSGLPFGARSYTVTADDKAVPPNQTSLTWMLTRVDPAAPANAAGVSPFLATAMNVDGAAAGAWARIQPGVASQVNVQDGKRYLTLSFRRRVSPAGFHYVLETSQDMIQWTAASATLLSSVPMGDGVTELATYQVGAVLSDTAKAFVRVHVTVD